MDPLSHIVAGRAVVALFDRDADRRAVGTAAIVGALSPDVDIALAPAGWDIYLRAHQAGTHSIVGGLLLGCVAAFLVRAFARRSRYLPLVAAAVAGAMSHLALDALSGARIRLAWPWADARVGLPLVAMGDPWLVAIFVAGLVAVWPGRQRRQNVAVFGPGTAIAFLCFKAVLLDRAKRRAHLDAASPRAAEARWGSLTEWDVYDRTPTDVRAWRISSGGAAAILRLSEPVFPESSLVTASRSLDTVSNFLRAHEFGFAVQSVETDGNTAVRWSDPSYCWRTADAGAAIECALWFGGVLGPNGRFVTQEVTVGTRKQTRAAPP